MTKLAFVDLDGVVANADARFAKAEDAKQEFLKSPPPIRSAFSVFSFMVALLTAQYSSNASADPTLDKQATDLYWQTVFTPSLVELDTVIGGINDSLMDLQDCGYQLVFLTSRPETMRDATSAWLLQNTVYDGDDTLIMKASAFQYVKTTVWKAGIIQTISSLNEYYTITDVLVIDDEQANLNEIERYRSTLGILLTAKSLEEAVLKVTGVWKETEAFLPEGD